jgi:hypothetical protein
MAKTTPALELADRMAAVAEHLRKHPYLQVFNAHSRGNREDLELQISAFSYLGETGGVTALLSWAKTMGDLDITVRWHVIEKQVVTVDVVGTIGGFRIRVWDTDAGDLHRWRTGGRFARTPITLDQLAAYVAAGTVENVAEFAPAVTS